MEGMLLLKIKSLVIEGSAEGFGVISIKIEDYEKQIPAAIVEVLFEKLAGLIAQAMEHAAKS